jgi:hypothetical protein
LPGETVFTTSGVFTVPKGVKSIDVFCVGGGGGAAYLTTGSTGGAGGGYTKTVKDIEVEPGQQITVTVGAGGVGANGGASSIGSYCSANGGYYGSGANGGSGGGPAPAYICYVYSIVSYGTYYNFPNVFWDGSYGGYDGNDASPSRAFDYTRNYYSGFNYGGKGQGTTTRYFGESGGTAYANGGNGAINICYYITDSTNGLCTDMACYNSYQNTPGGGGCPYPIYGWTGVYGTYGQQTGWTTHAITDATTGKELSSGRGGVAIIKWDPKNFKKS